MRTIFVGNKLYFFGRNKFMKTTLVVMAAGMGSRFGGLKQAEPITPDGKCILDFSVYDAKKAGFINLSGALFSTSFPSSVRKSLISSLTFS